MPQGLEKIRNTLAQISKGENGIAMLCEFERTLSDTGIFAYANWLDGELVEGPDITKYWFTTTWMYHQSDMPDPRGAMRLKNIGCNVYFTEDTLLQPRHIIEPSDWENQASKKAKLDEIPVWLIKIEMPIRFITDTASEISQVEEDESIDANTQSVAADFASDDEEDNDFDEFDNGEL